MLHLTFAKLIVATSTIVVGGISTGLLLNNPQWMGIKPWTNYQAITVVIADSTLTEDNNPNSIMCKTDYGTEVFDCAIIEIPTDNTHKWMGLNELSSKTFTQVLEKSFFTDKKTAYGIKLKNEIYNKLKFDGDEGIQVFKKSWPNRVLGRIYPNVGVITTDATTTTYKGKSNYVVAQATKFGDSTSNPTSLSLENKTIKCSLDGTTQQDCKIVDFSANDTTSSSLALGTSVVYKYSETPSTTINQHKYYLIKFKDEITLGDKATTKVYVHPYDDANTASTPISKIEFEHASIALLHPVKEKAFSIIVQ